MAQSNRDQNRITTLIGTSDIDNKTPVNVKTGATSGRLYVDTSDLQDLISEEYEFCGVQSSGGYTYFGFKKYSNGSWKIMRMTDADDSEVLFAYGTTGFASSWATPSGESYALPPDS